jgi:hypothetical protein
MFEKCVRSMALKKCIRPQLRYINNLTVLSYRRVLVCRLLVRVVKFLLFSPGRNCHILKRGSNQIKEDCWMRWVSPNFHSVLECCRLADRHQIMGKFRYYGSESKI